MYDQKKKIRDSWLKSFLKYQENEKFFNVHDYIFLMLCIYRNKYKFLDKFTMKK